MPEKNELCHRCMLLAKVEVADRWFLMRLQAPGLLRAEPGQFVHLRVGSGSDPLLRRPFSVHYVDEHKGEIRILVRVAGAATAALAELPPGSTLDLLGPLGRGFPLCAAVAAGKALLVGGGIGLAPLYFLADRLLCRGVAVDFLIGGAGAAALPGDSYFHPLGLKPRVATEDGSRGFKGTVAELLESYLRHETAGCLYACGPLPMLARVVGIAAGAGVPVYVSLEAHLACAVGACLGCAFPFKTPLGVECRRVCRDGPVFPGEEVYFNGA